MKSKKLPYHYYYSPIILLSCTGLVASVYLAISHYKNYTDISYSSFCAISQSINCDTVSQSAFSFMLGIPVAFWGILAYALFLLLSIAASGSGGKNGFIWDLLLAIALIFCIFDIYFAYLAIFKIKAYCIVCLLTYVVSFGLLFLTFIIRRRFNEFSFFSGLSKSFSFFTEHRSLSITIAVLFLFFFSLKVILPQYWLYEYPELSDAVDSGVTEDGHYWIGSLNPEITIHEFADYQCFQCSKMHLTLRLLVNEHPERLRLIHYHYPMDEKFNTVLVKTPFHSGSGALALLAIAAGKQGKFWQANDALYSIARQGITEFNITKFSEKLGTDTAKLKEGMNSLKVLKELEADIRKGLKNNIIGTPSYIINEKVYHGSIPPDILKDIVDE